MNKIPTIFERDWDGDRSRVLDKPVHACAWVFAGDGVATRKLDGTACMVRAGKLYKRHEVKADKGRAAPEGFEQVAVDEETGNVVGWVPVGDGPEDRWHREAFQLCSPLQDGTYELIGPKIQRNPERSLDHILVPHTTAKLALADPPARTFPATRSPRAATATGCGGPTRATSVPASTCATVACCAFRCGCCDRATRGTYAATGGGGREDCHGFRLALRVPRSRLPLRRLVPPRLEVLHRGEVGSLATPLDLMARVQDRGRSQGSRERLARLQGRLCLSKGVRMRSAATRFPVAEARLREALEIRDRNLAAEEKILNGHIEELRKKQETVDYFDASVQRIRAEVAEMRAELEAMTDA